MTKLLSEIGKPPRRTDMSLSGMLFPCRGMGLSVDGFYSAVDMWTYNNERPNMGIGGITPAQKLKMTA